MPSRLRYSPNCAYSSLMGKWFGDLSSQPHPCPSPPTHDVHSPHLRTHIYNVHNPPHLRTHTYTMCIPPTSLPPRQTHTNTHTHKLKKHLRTHPSTHTCTSFLPCCNSSSSLVMRVSRYGGMNSASAPSLKFTMAADACAWTCERARVKCEV